jgi:hypothetical protein
MDNFLADRSQMGMPLGFHIIFAVIGVSLPLMMTIRRVAMEIDRRPGVSVTRETLDEGDDHPLCRRRDLYVAISSWQPTATGHSASGRPVAYTDCAGQACCQPQNMNLHESVKILCRRLRTSVEQN